jgi:hypothetical protein
MPIPTAMPTATPDVYQLALGNIQAQATLDAMQATSQSISANLTATAFAPTQQAIGTATERAWTMAGWTATTAIEQTATSSSATATAQSWTPTPNFTATVEAAQASAQATALHGQAVSIELAVERERMTNQVRAILPIAFTALTVIVALVLLWRYTRVRPIQRDSRGDAPLLIIDGTIYDADRNPLPVMQMQKGQPQIPMLTPPELQAPTTARDQAVDLARALPPGKAQQQMQRAMLANDQPTFQVVQPNKLPPLLTGDPQMTRVLDAEWRQDENTQ